MSASLPAAAGGPVVSGATRLAAVIGWPVRHSLSPVIHNAAFRACGLDWVHVALEVAPGDAPAAVVGLRALGIAGVSVTMPHKAAVIASLDDLRPVARRLGAVNCIFWEEGRLVGDNTDGAGFLAGLRREWDLDVAGANVVVIGSGGAASAVADALVGAGAAPVGVVGRTREAVEAIVARGGGVVSVCDHDAVGTADLVVNATPVGMDAHPGEPSPVAVGTGRYAVDLVYHPRSTTWMTRCADAGAQVMGGIPMLVGQAEVAFELWTGVAAPHDAIVDALAAAEQG